MRVAVGWERLPDKYDRILANSYTHFTVRQNNELVGFLNVISDGIGDAFLVDLMVHPKAQHQGIGRALVDAAVEGLTGEFLSRLWFLHIQGRHHRQRREAVKAFLYAVASFRQD